VEGRRRSEGESRGKDREGDEIEGKGGEGGGK